MQPLLPPLGQRTNKGAGAELVVLLRPARYRFGLLVRVVDNMPFDAPAILATDRRDVRRAYA
ncbi:hypothetical protein [Robbsia sp. KACC 23696]|uniref:hypothetical protein n=1 Tax=Robbsia sp. KACC 23696 TaxID=3149231 RepID=UPI00325AC9EF